MPSWGFDFFGRAAHRTRGNFYIYQIIVEAFTKSIGEETQGVHSMGYRDLVPSQGYYLLGALYFICLEVL